MRLGVFGAARSTATRADGAKLASRLTCLQCGIVSPEISSTFCRRCGLPFGARPRADRGLPACPICYRSVDEDGRLPALRAGRRLDLAEHLDEHVQHPVGDDEYLESLRIGDRIRVGRFVAPFDLVRRYLVTGALEAGHRRSYDHTAIVTAMGQIGRWGMNATLMGDQLEWREAREAVGQLMERYARGGAQA
jgi:hypothetical protein